jgi:hypothetical protein
MDLSLGPFLIVSRIYVHIFSLMLHSGIHLAADNPIAGSAASLRIYYYILADFLNPVHD